ncbi:MAG TPA: ABC transporter ATP-binding protein [Alphaproteobacteria bacterium]|nr:ABC transporter ATP-binding protein [Alphaproteobacteria bacterium]
MNRPIVSIENISKLFGNVTAVDDVSLKIVEGEFFALLGPSGCGKTTLLRMLAGFEIPSSGRIVIDDVEMEGIDPNRRPVNMVFQSYAVFPHMTVVDNVAYGLKVTGVPRPEIEARVEEALALVKLDGFERRMPSQLSGGQRQRVALARALIKRPKVLLLDEPLSALDAKLREAMQLELVRLRNAVGITFVIVTHDQDEALSMANRIAVMDRGRVVQVAGPAELYEFPNSRFVADFIGKINLLDAQVAGMENGRLLADSPGLGRVAVPFSGAARAQIGLAVRPEKVKLERNEPTVGRLKIRGRVREIAYYGDESHVFIEADPGLVITANVSNDARTIQGPVAVGDEVWVSWAPTDTLVLTE